MVFHELVFMGIISGFINQQTSHHCGAPSCEVVFRFPSFSRPSPKAPALCSTAFDGSKIHPDFYGEWDRKWDNITCLGKISTI